jgi:hypothetical protein
VETAAGAKNRTPPATPGERKSPRTIRQAVFNTVMAMMLVYANNERQYVNNRQSVNN